MNDGIFLLQILNKAVSEDQIDMRKWYKYALAAYCNGTFLKAIRACEIGTSIEQTLGKLESVYLNILFSFSNFVVFVRKSFKITGGKIKKSF